MDETLIHSVFKQDGGGDDETTDKRKRGSRQLKGNESFDISGRRNCDCDFETGFKIFSMKLQSCTTSTYSQQRLRITRIRFGPLDPQNEILSIDFTDRNVRELDELFYQGSFKISDLSRVVLVDNNPLWAPQLGSDLGAFVYDPNDMYDENVTFLRELDDTKDVRQVLEKLTIEQLSNINDDDKAQGN